MDIKVYSEKASEFAIYPQVGNNLSYAILGLCDEFCEFMTAQGKQALFAEFGDVLWYFNCLISIELKKDFAEFVSRGIYATSNKRVLPPFKLIAKLLGNGKKYMRDDNYVLTDERSLNTYNAAVELFSFIWPIINDYKLLEQALEQNIAKLTDRKLRDALKGDGDYR